MLLVDGQVDALAAAARLRELTQPAALAAVEAVAARVDALVAAAALPRAPGAVTGRRIDATLLLAVRVRRRQESALPASAYVSNGCRSESYGYGYRHEDDGGLLHGRKRLLSQCRKLGLERGEGEYREL